MIKTNYTKIPNNMHIVGEIVFTRNFSDDEYGVCNLKIEEACEKKLTAAAKQKAIEDYIAAQTQLANCNHHCEQCSSPCGCGSCYFFADEVTLNGGSLLFLAQADNKDNIILCNQTTFPVPFLLTILNDLRRCFSDYGSIHP